MNRRTFLARTVGALAAAAVLPKIAEALPGATGETLSTSGWAESQKLADAVQFEVGDIITISGRYALNPLTYQPTGHLRQFVVTAVHDDGAGAYLSVSPQIITHGEYQNVTRLENERPVGPRSQVMAWCVTPVHMGRVVPLKIIDQNNIAFEWSSG